MCITNQKILIRGAGEVASAIAHKLGASNFKVCLTDIAKPLAVSRGVSFCEVMYDGEKTIEGVTAKLISSADEIEKTWQEGDQLYFIFHGMKAGIPQSREDIREFRILGY